MHLVDSSLCSNASQYMAALLLSLNVMLALELPHVNLLSKIDLVESRGDLDFNLDYYTEVCPFPLPSIIPLRPVARLTRIAAILHVFCYVRCFAMSDPDDVYCPSTVNLTWDFCSSFLLYWLIGQTSLIFENMWEVGNTRGEALVVEYTYLESSKLQQVEDPAMPFPKLIQEGLALMTTALPLKSWTCKLTCDTPSG